MSTPPGISSRCGCIAEEGSADAVINTGCFGLFFEPDGRPRGRFASSMLEPSPATIGGERSLQGFLVLFSTASSLLTSSENGASGFIISQPLKIMNRLYGL
ncbi:hypothetical protein IEQ34_015953 [Dendrobium chrysotoxum]|uniref:Uncharacterized protein n=1 Tax=Dendrobium chrysotoxum TaxID=161865 RepID=A0AAV7GHJ2_DENCH|nr:hypothetical protein IEQ34_015953 [Dendrobium chrysotoxum]